MKFVKDSVSAFDILFPPRPDISFFISTNHQKKDFRFSKFSEMVVLKWVFAIFDININSTEGEMELLFYLLKF